MPKPAPLPLLQARGLAARKHVSRSAHAEFSASACRHDPLALLRKSERGRVPALLAIKHQRMAASAFGFFRGAVPVMAADLACHPNTGILTQLCGDAHVLNLGAFATGANTLFSDPAGNLTFDINDFDETIRGPFELDLKRLATSLLLAGREAGIKRSARRDAVLHFAARYRDSMHTFAAMPVLDLARYQIHRIAHVDPMPAILAAAERSTPQKSLHSLTELGTRTNRVPQGFTANSHQLVAVRVPQGFSLGSHKPEEKAGALAPEGTRDTRVPQGFSLGFHRSVGKKGALAPEGSRRFRSDPPLLTPLPAKERSAVLAALASYATTLQPERRHFLAQYTPIDVAFKVVGTGSVGLRDYCIYFENPNRKPGTDPLFLQIKEETPSAWSPYLPHGDAHTHQGHRAMDGQRAMQLTSDPFLGYTTINGRDFLVRQLNDHKASLDLKALTPASLLGYADLCGELFARGHARAGDPIAIAAYLGKSPRFDRALLTFARSYADKTEHDWSLFKKSLK
jgi:uncharacterized protein (DUF2252 family)